jgi:hypothetical protein
MRNRRLETRHLFLLSLLGLGLVLGNGCAGSRANYKAAQPLKEGTDLAGYKNLEITAEKAEGVEMTPEALNRIVSLVATKVQTKAPGRFEKVNASAPAAVRYTMTFTKYAKGNAFARAMLAGLGQIHIYADVTVTDTAKNEVIGKYKITKTFALGGIYGASTRVEDCEDGFTEGMVDLILKAKK